MSFRLELGRKHLAHSYQYLINMQYASYQAEMTHRAVAFVRAHRHLAPGRKGDWVAVTGQ